MKLRTVFIRFYKSFNFDYLRKYHPRSDEKIWEKIDDMWYPYVRIPIDPQVTTVVGANESGKSHLLSAIEKGVTGIDIKREDFCRYSQFFTVEKGTLKQPEFGFEWSDLSDQEREIFLMSGIPEPPNGFDRFLMFRTNQHFLTIYVPSDNGYSKYDLNQENAIKLQSLLPRIFTIDRDIALPDSVPIRRLVSNTTADDVIESLGKQERNNFLDKISQLGLQMKNSENSDKVIKDIKGILTNILSTSQEEIVRREQEKKEKELELVRKLILKVARVDPNVLTELYNAIKSGKEGHANGIIRRINDQLETNLNFPRWWVQDKNFQLVVSPREYDLVFTIRDRTGTEYSFTERSSGLKYFLSYYIQYRSHEPVIGRSEILLMDEPDAYLSSQAQQDLLRIFQAFANPDDGRLPVQVIYVTHSPFLIDKNHSERIRVLEKGVGDEGTRVVKDASKNHYEPLRSAFGAFVGETTFIGNCNLMVEGQADQILIAGVASYLQSHKVPQADTIDLNHVTIVPAGSSSHIPYLVYLARGRDVEQPAVIVLLDSDKSGIDARKRFRKSVVNNKQILKEELILQIGELDGLVTDAHTLTEIEDLIPLPICIEVARNYVKDVCGVSDAVANKIDEHIIKKNLTDSITLFDAVAASLKEISDDLHIEKVGFARTTINVITSLSKQDCQNEALQFFEDNMKILFRRLNKMRREAEREHAGERISQRISRDKSTFLQDHSKTAKREDANVLLEGIEARLDRTFESDYIKIAIAKLRQKFRLDEDVIEPIEDYEKFKEALEGIQYVARVANEVEE